MDIDTDMEVDIDIGTDIKVDIDIGNDIEVDIDIGTDIDIDTDIGTDIEVDIVMILISRWISCSARAMLRPCPTLREALRPCSCCTP